MIIFAMILATLNGAMLQKGTDSYLGQKLGSTGNGTRNVYVFESTPEELEVLQRRQSESRVRHDALKSAVYARDNSAAAARLFHILDVEAGQRDLHAFDSQAIAKLPAQSLVAAGDYCLNVGDLAGAQLIAERLLKSPGNEDGLLYIELVQQRSRGAVLPRSELATGILLSIYEPYADELEPVISTAQTQAQREALVHAARGLLSDHTGQLEKANYHFQFATQLDPSNAYYKMALGRCQIRLGEIESGKRLLREVEASGLAKLARQAREVLNRVGG